MKIVFFATAQFACQILKELVKENHNIAAIVTQPDKPKGRHLVLSKPPIKILAQQLGLDILQPIDLDDAEFIRQLKDLNADVFVVVSFGKIIKMRILGLPKKMCINIHASLLPKYRGAAPINWAIANGEKQTGVTIIKMNERIDEGDIILQKSISIGQDDNFLSLSQKLSSLGAQALIEALELVKENKIKLIPQDKTRATYTLKLKKSDGLINWNESAVRIYNKMRAFLPWPGAFTYFNGKLLKIVAAKTVFSEKDISIEPAAILDISKKGILVATGKDNLLIQELQLEGRRCMAAEEFLAGHNLKLGQKIGI